MKNAGTQILLLLLGIAVGAALTTLGARSAAAPQTSIAKTELRQAEPSSITEKHELESNEVARPKKFEPDIVSTPPIPDAQEVRNLPAPQVASAPSQMPVPSSTKPEQIIAEKPAAEQPKPLVLNGRIISKLDVDVKGKVSGQILRLPVDVGDVVSKDQVIAELDTTDEDRAVQRAQLAVKSSQTRLEQAKQSLQIAEQSIGISKARFDASLRSHEVKAKRSNDRLARLKDPAKKQFISKEEYDDAEAEAIIANAQLESMRAQHEDLKTQEMALKLKKQDVDLAETQLEMDKLTLSNAQQRVSETRVMAPISGVVTYRYVQTGNVIIAGTSMQGTRLFTISDMSELFVVAPVEPSQLGQISIGASVKIVCDACPEMTFHGKVRRIAPRGTSAGPGVTFEVKIEILDENRDQIKPDFPAKVMLDLCEKDS